MDLSFHSYEEARAAFAEDRAMHEVNGVTLDSAVTYIPESWKRDYRLALDDLRGIVAQRYAEIGIALDAQPALSTDPNAGIPSWFTMVVDPKIFRILFAPVKMAEILGEQRKGTWLDETAMFPVVEHTGEVETYGDNSEGGNANVNINFPQRQSYEFQTVIRYGQKELERAGLARIGYVTELGVASANALNRFLNLTYAFGVGGLQCYGLLNDPNLPAALSPTTKAANTGSGASGTNAWMYNGALNATANEIWNDIQAMFWALVNNSAGLVDQETPLTLAMSPGSQAAMLATNSYNVNVSDLIKKNLPSLTVKTAVQYGVRSTANPEGIAAGNLVQMIANDVEGQEQGFCAFNEKMRSFPIVRGMSNFKQKQMSGTWGTVYRATIGVQQMIGV